MVVIVEDEAALRHVVERILTTNGYPVLSAGDGVEALALLQAHHGDLLLTAPGSPHTPPGTMPPDQRRIGRTTGTVTAGNRRPAALGCRKTRPAPGTRTPRLPHRGCGPSATPDRLGIHLRTDDMIDTIVTDKARTLRALHEQPVLVLPNAWDPVSAALMARAGAAAVVEGGYGPSPEDVAATVRATIDAGVVGMNIEDSRAADGALLSVEEQVRRVRAARNAAADAGLPRFVINVRTDVYLLRIGDPAGRLDEVLSRAAGYAGAGADCLFVPGLLDLDTLGALTAASPLPVNAMTGPGGPSVAELTAAGVRRISVGTAMTQAAYGAAERAARELLTTGTCRTLEHAPSYPDINALCLPAPHPHGIRTGPPDPVQDRAAPQPRFQLQPEVEPQPSHT